MKGKGHGRVWLKEKRITSETFHHTTILGGCLSSASQETQHWQSTQWLVKTTLTFRPVPNTVTGRHVSDQKAIHICATNLSCCRWSTAGWRVCSGYGIV